LSLLLLFVTVVVLAVVGVCRSGFIFRKLGVVLGLHFSYVKRQRKSQGGFNSGWRKLFSCLMKVFIFIHTFIIRIKFVPF